jgi:hypothetical protein
MVIPYLMSCWILIITRFKVNKFGVCNLRSPGPLRSEVRILSSRPFSRKESGWYNETLQVPEIVSVEGGGALSGASANLSAGQQSNENSLKTFLRENSGLYGLTAEQVDQLVKVSDHKNPEGNLAFVEYQQEMNGIPVFLGRARHPDVRWTA